MRYRYLRHVVVGAIVLTLGACVAPGAPAPGQPGAIDIRQGVIEQITTGTLSV